MRTSSEVAGIDLQQLIESEWRTYGNADLVAVLRRRPDILHDKSLLLNLAVREFQAWRRKSDVHDLAQHCSRFREFGGSIEHSIFRQLDVQRLVDDCLDSSGIVTEPDWPKMGEQFGNFHVLEELGFGSMARVYLCLQCDLGNRQVVVKASPQPSIEPAILGKLNHPNITPIFSTGYVEGIALHFLCTPFLGRSTLTDLIDLAFADGSPDERHVRLAAIRWYGGRAEIRRPWYRRFAGFAERTYVDGVLDLAIPIASALEHAHSHRILHGDLKPSNVLLTYEGRPLLLDFNLSHDYATYLRRCGGTLPYMPPEHLQLVAEGGAHDFDAKFHPAADIFSFGALIHELLYGTTPLEMPKSSHTAKEIAADFIQQYRDGAKPPEDRHGVSGGLRSLVNSCIAFDRSQRPHSMALVRERLADERQWMATMSRRAKAHPIAYSVVAGLGVGVVATTGLFVSLQPPRHERAYAAGIRAAESRDLSDAISHFDEAISQNPSFNQARFARGRAYLHSDNLDFAMKDFHHLARTGDARAMALLAYCYNLQDMSLPAVPWYEKAIEHQATSTAIENNLGACYLIAQTHLSQEQQIQRAERHLQRALANESDSSVIQLNTVRLEAKKAARDFSHNPSSAWIHAFAILTAKPQDPVVQFHVKDWYRKLMRFAERTGTTDRLPDVFGIERGAWEAFQAPGQTHATSNEFASKKLQAGSSEPRAQEISYFLEPFLLENGT
jgi:serine/threonine protein kinase